MKQVIERINKALKKEHFAVVQIYGVAGSGKTILANEILSKFPDYDTRRINDLRPLKEMYIHNSIEIIEDLHFKIYKQDRLRVLQNIDKFYTKPKIRANLIRIIVTGRKIELQEALASYRHIKHYCINVTTGLHHCDLPPSLKSRVFQKKIRNVFKRKLKTRPYLITSKPLIIGRYKHNAR